jgi:predicted MPP superfamily phosphohydrolase
MKLAARRAMLLSVALAVQVPALYTLVRLTRRPLLVAVLAAALLVPLFAAARNVWDHRPRSRLHLYLVLWPFFIWGTICLVFTTLFPLALLVAWFTPVSLDRSLAVAGAVALLGSARALSRRPRVSRHSIVIPGLPESFAGFRIAHISDLHCGPFTPPQRVRRWVDRVNALDADLVAVTGDLITTGADYVPAVAACLGDLRAREAVFGSLGNHDYFTDGEAFARELERRGLPLLRNRGVTLSRGDDQLYVCGVDDTWTRRDDVSRSLRGRPPRAACVMLAHDPALFTQAAAQGVALILAGHTHGGQLAFPLAPRRWNLARLMSPFTVGLYRIGASTLYVNRGLGTTGPPIRIGAPPEIAVLTLMPGEPVDDRLRHLAEDVIRDVS